MHYSCLHIWFLWTYFQMTPAMLILSLASLIFPDLSQVCYDPTNNTWPNSLYIYAIDSFSSWIYFTCVCFHWILLCYFPLFLQSDKIITSPEHTGWNRTCLWLFSFFLIWWNALNQTFVMEDFWWAVWVTIFIGSIGYSTTRLIFLS